MSNSTSFITIGLERHSLSKAQPCEKFTINHWVYSMLELLSPWTSFTTCHKDICRISDCESLLRYFFLLLILHTYGRHAEACDVLWWEGTHAATMSCQVRCGQISRNIVRCIIYQRCEKTCNVIHVYDVQEGIELSPTDSRWTYILSVFIWLNVNCNNATQDSYDVPQAPTALHDMYPWSSILVN